MTDCCISYAKDSEYAIAPADGIVHWTNFAHSEKVHVIYYTIGQER